MYNKWLRGVRITGFHFPYVRILFEWISASKYSRWHIANVAFELHWRDSFSLNISPYTVQCTLYIPHLQSKHVNHIHPHSCNKQHNTTQSMPFIKIPFLKRKQKKQQLLILHPCRWANISNSIEMFWIVCIRCLEFRNWCKFLNSCKNLI